MVPRPDVVGARSRCPRGGARLVLDSPYTRYPVFRESLDDILGILHIRALVSALNDRRIADVAIEELLQPAYVVPETKDLGALLGSSGARTSTWRSSSTSTARRTGSSRSRTCSRRSSATSRTSSTSRRVGRARRRHDDPHRRSFTIDDFNEQFGTEIDDEDFHTVAGFVFGHLGRAAESATRSSTTSSASRCSRRAARGSSGSRSSSCPPPSGPTTRRSRLSRREKCDALRDAPFARVRSRIGSGARPLRTATSRSTSSRRSRRRSRSRWRSSRSAGRSTIHRDPLDLGLVGLAMFVPLPLLALPAGHLADRYPRRTVLAARDRARRGGRGRAARRDAVGRRRDVAVLRARVRHRRRVRARGARRARMTPSLVPQEILVRAFAQRSVAFQASVICGPALGGLLFAIEPELVYAVAGGLSVVALLAAARAPLGSRGRRASARPTSRACSAACGSSAGRPVLCSARSRSTSSPCSSEAVALLPVFARDVLEVGPAGSACCGCTGSRRAAPRSS